tara:strand:- start:263 stop:505 length:243 start_codon:yes stop_codon:yes gene_type:complete
MTIKKIKELLGCARLKYRESMENKNYWVDVDSSIYLRSDNPDKISSVTSGMKKVNFIGYWLHRKGFKKIAMEFAVKQNKK